MNMLYEAIKERGSMVIVPSSAVETMGLGGNLAAVALAKGTDDVGSGDMKPRGVALIPVRCCVLRVDGSRYND